MTPFVTFAYWLGLAMVTAMTIVVGPSLVALGFMAVLAAARHVVTKGGR